MAFVSLLQRFGTHCNGTRHENIAATDFAGCLALGGYEALSLPNEQRLDF